MADLTRRKLLTVVVESALEKRLVADLTELGASGYTVQDARGLGDHGLRGADYEFDRNIRVEVLCDEEAARRIAERIYERYSDSYAMVMWVANVEVLRPEKFDVDGA